MNRTESSFRRHPGSGSLRRFSFRRKATRESLPEPTSTWSFNNDSHEWQLLREDGAQIQLVYNKSEHIPLKDFAAEIRGGKDIKEFILSALVLLDVQDTSIWDLLEIILRRIKQTSLPNNDSTPVLSSSSLSNATTTMINNTVITTSSGHRENLNIEEIKRALFVNDRVRILAKTLQATTATETNWTYDQSWLAIMCTSPSILKRHVAIARLKYPCNLGRNCQEARFIVFILSPMREKGTKNFLETGRTFATIFADIELRAKLLKATTQQEFISIIDKHTDHLMEQQQTSHTRNSLPDAFDDNNINSEVLKVKTYYCPILSDMYMDLSRRLPHYFSDFYDIFQTYRGSQKVLSTAVFLYFACLLPSIAFGVLNSQVTNDQISVPKAVASQCLGGIFFSIFSGQPLIVVMTTAPLTIYVKVIFVLCTWYRLDFRDTYALVGLWNSFFLILYSLFGVSKIMKWSTRSTEEIFALFVSIAFLVDASTHVYRNRILCLDFTRNYSTTVCKQYDEYWKLRRMNKNVTFNFTEGTLEEPCSRDSSLLYILLTLGTVWLGTFLYKFKQTPYLTSAKRELLTDYALPVSVIIMSLIGSLLFSQINLQSFSVDHRHLFVLVRFKSITFKQIIATGGLGFSLSLLMFLDQNIAGAIVNSPANKLKKGKAFHIDLFVIAILNGWLSLFGLTWMHALPLSPLHVKALADTEERVEQGHIQSVIVKVRETRLTVLLSHIFIGMSLFMRDILKQIPMPVLDGLFLYLALTSLDGNQFFERVTLFFTEQAAYPPNHYIRQVPQRKIHLFTFLQLLQLIILCFLGFSPILYSKLVLPIWLVAMVAFRYRILPKVIAKKYLRVLDQRL
ncbi:unnamed protein product [Rotaria sp. Silwood2]|nr:unnamed protein product [Rotaria sp. Silwood2]CAF3977889.1 unnamed protein product [Rotaria sp. Silwood2]CAF4186126.1 unnamed protein product [Rotaria sp. Silwood2]